MAMTGSFESFKFHSRKLYHKGFKAIFNNATWYATVFAAFRHSHSSIIFGGKGKTIPLRAETCKGFLSGRLQFCVQLLD